MPAKKGSKNLVHKQSLLGTFQKNKRTILDMEDKIENQEKLITEHQVIFSANEEVLKKLTVDIDNTRRKVSRKQQKLKCLQTQSNLLSDSKIDSLARNEEDVYISSNTIKKRKANPTTHELNQKAKQIRRYCCVQCNSRIFFQFV